MQNITISIDDTSIIEIIITVFKLIMIFIDFRKTFRNIYVPKSLRVAVYNASMRFVTWVEKESNSKKVDNRNMKNWIMNEDGVDQTLRSHLIYKKIVKLLRKQGYSELNVMGEESYENWVREYDSSPKWEEKEV